MYVVLGVSAGIAAYKSIELVRLFQKKNCDVRVVMTKKATNFISPLTFEAITRKPVIYDMFTDVNSQEVEHISLARRADVLCVAPATADIISKFANGIADDFLSTLFLSMQAPVVIAPSMNVAMWEHPATQHNTEILRKRGVKVVEPGIGYLACGEEGSGRLADLDFIVEAIFNIKTPKTLQGKKVLVTAGPTRQSIDPVRFISNRSTGSMGIEIARQLGRRGAEVTLVIGPSCEKIDFPCKILNVESAEEMADATLSVVDQVNAVFMAAAVADYTPKKYASEKIKKDSKILTLELKKTTDILSNVSRKAHAGLLIVGFAAESSHIEKNASAKLRRKKLHFIVANKVGKNIGFGTQSTSVLILGHDGIRKELKNVSKLDVANTLCDLAEEWFKKTKK